MAFRTCSFVGAGLAENASEICKLGDGYPPSVHESIMPSMLADESFSQCSATRSRTGRYGTVDSSHVLLSCIFATVLRPACRANDQCLVARGPGPTADNEYSPTVVLIPPRAIGNDHSLTDISQLDLGRALITSGATASGQPQSQTITFALALPPCTPRSMALFTSARISAGIRSLHLGQSFSL